MIPITLPSNTALNPLRIKLIKRDVKLLTQLQFNYFNLNLIAKTRNLLFKLKSSRIVAIPPSVRVCKVCECTICASVRVSADGGTICTLWNKHHVKLGIYVSQPDACAIIYAGIIKHIWYAGFGERQLLD